MQEKWILKNNKENFDKLSEKMPSTLTKEDPYKQLLILKLLSNRGIDSVDKANKFLTGDYKDFYSPFLLKDMEKAIKIIEDGVKNNKKIAIYGDYDCDGVISTVILYNALEKLNADFMYHIPDREEEGYGMHPNRVRILKEQGVDIILTCDNGIAAVEEVKLAKELGMTVIVTDHHDVPENVPIADAIINPKQEACLYPFKSLCGAGVALKFVEALFEVFNIPKEEAYKLIEYAAIATVCDVVDLLDENRIIVKKGLEMMNASENIGLQELIKVTNIKNGIVNEYHLGFVIGPCINATGRLESASLSVDLLLEKDRDKASDLAQTLFDLNQKRQELTQESTERIIKNIEETKSEDEKVIVVYDELIHESIAGIVAGRVREKFNLPCIVLSKGKEMPKGSARSIEGYNMFEELTKCKEVICKFGGHPMAAGLSIEEEKIDDLRDMLNEKCALTDDDIVPKVIIDSPLSLEQIDFRLLELLEELRPFGKSNGTPSFAVKGAMLNRVWLIGKEKNILKARFKLSNGLQLEGITFDKLEYLKEEFINSNRLDEFNDMVASTYANYKVDIIFYPEINEFMGNRKIQIIIKNIRLSS